MTHLLAQVRLQRTSLLPEDVVINTFHFEVAGSPTSGHMTTMDTRLTEFYRTAPAITGGLPINSILSNEIAAIEHEVRVYNMAEPQPRSPAGTFTILVDPVGASLPAEVALVMSLKAAPLSGEPAARRRGRLYLGPLRASLMGTTVDAGDVRPTAITCQSVSAAGARLAAYSTEPFFRIYSETNDDLLPIAFVDVDNSYDTQRRRGADPTVRYRTAV